MFKRFVRVMVLAAIFSLAMLCTSSAYESEINKLSATMAEKIAGAKKAKVAVVDFTDLQGDVTELGRFIAEEFSVALAGAGKGFKVVDRTHLKSIIKENKLSSTGMIDPETARKLGKIAGVEALVTGTLTPFGDSVRISVKILDTATAEVIEAKRGNIAKTQAIEELLARGITGRESLTGKSKPTRKSGSTIKTQVVKGFSFELQECRISSKIMTCRLLVTNNEKDRNFRVHTKWNDFYRTRAFDDLSNEYTVAGIKFANKSSDSKKVEHLLVSGLTTEIVLNFENVSEEANILALLEISCWEIASDTGFKVQFRNIPFSK